MILATHGFLASSIGQFDADAVAFFNRVTTAGGTLSATERNAVNTLVIQMKTDGIWTKMKAIYPMVGASAAACAQNLKSSSFTGTFTSGWTFASTGALPNGTSAYMNTNLLPSTSLTNNNTHLSFYSRSNTTTVSGERVEIGAYSGPTTDLFEIQIRHSDNTFRTSAYNFSTFRLSSSNSDSRGFFIGSRASNVSLKNYKNGSLLNTNSTTNTTNVTTNSTNTMFIAAINPGTNPIGSFSNRECAFTSIGDGLTDSEASNLYTAVQAFQTTLSRQV
jgi:hypothetical protein